MWHTNLQDTTELSNANLFAEHISWVIWQGVLFYMVIFKNGLKMISWIELLSTLWFFLNLFYLVWNFCVRIMKELAISSRAHLCFLCTKFFYRLQDDKAIITETTLWRQLVFQRLNSWKILKTNPSPQPLPSTSLSEKILNPINCTSITHDISISIFHSKSSCSYIMHFLTSLQAYCHFSCHHDSPSFPPIKPCLSQSPRV